jgi:hypothetical protein
MRIPEFPQAARAKAAEGRDSVLVPESNLINRAGISIGRGQGCAGLIPDTPFSPPKCRLFARGLQSLRFPLRNSDRNARKVITLRSGWADRWRRGIILLIGGAI